MEARINFLGFTSAGALQVSHRRPCGPASTVSLQGTQRSLTSASLLGEATKIQATFGMAPTLHSLTWGLALLLLATANRPTPGFGVQITKPDSVPMARLAHTSITAHVTASWQLPADSGFFRGLCLLSLHSPHLERGLSHIYKWNCHRRTITLQDEPKCFPWRFDFQMRKQTQPS